MSKPLTKPMTREQLGALARIANELAPVIAYPISLDFVIINLGLEAQNEAFDSARMTNLVRGIN